MQANNDPLEAQLMKRANVKIDEDVKKHMLDFAKQLVMYVDKQESDFLFPFIKKHLGNRKVTVNRMVKRGIKRFYNEQTYEVWYELDGQVITPAFIRDPRELIKSFKKSD